MTLPASGPISTADINVELGRASTTPADMLFINNLVLPAQRHSAPNMNSFYNKAYFQNNNNGNCNNGNCNCGACNCGNIQCSNCTNCNAINCTNCDTQQWLQTNCNCACTYNCTTNEYSYDCDCNCACAC